MNKDKLIAVCHKVSEDTELNFNSVLIYYFMEVILERLSYSSYKDNFVFKGGFVLSNIVGIKTRSTLDIDFLIRNTMFNEKNIIEILSVALDKKYNNDIECSIYNVRKINYKGKRLST